MRRWWQPILSLGASFTTAGIAALLRRAMEMPETPAADIRDRSGVERTHRGRPGARASGVRSLAVDFLSDVLAETYRKVRATGEHERKRR